MPQEAIQALDVSLNHSISLNPRCQSVARAFFFEGGLKQNLGFGAEVSNPSVLQRRLNTTLT